jgi:radical SAM superfamily enzyme YgiQ (UPF0313 family)
MRILLVNPRDATYSHGGGAFRRSLSYPALTLPTLAALVPPEITAEVRIVDEGVEELTDLWDADLVGITAVTASANRAYEIADQARAAGATAVLGGVHPTLLPEEAAGHADAVVTGLADDAWPEVLRDHAAGRLRPRYDGREDVDLAGRPWPRRDLLNRRRYLDVPTLQASRGCVNGCAFCTIPAAWGRRFHRRPVDEVAREVAALGSRRVLFLDPALLEDRTNALALLRALAALGVRWGGLATIRAAFDDELLDLAAASRCVGLLVGFESLNQESLDGAGKTFGEAGRYAEAVRRFHDRGIAVLGCFVFGFDQDGEDVFERTAAFVDRAGIDAVRYAVYTPFPGTPAFAALEREGRILSRDWSRYTTEDVVFRPRRMTVDRLERGLADAWRRTYGLVSIGRRTRWLSRTAPLALALNLGFRFYGRTVFGGREACRG